MAGSDAAQGQEIRGARHLRRAAFVSGVALLVTFVRMAWTYDPFDSTLSLVVTIMILQAFVTIGLWLLVPGVWLLALFVFGGFGILSAFLSVGMLYTGLSDGWNPWHGITPASAGLFG